MPIHQPIPSKTLNLQNLGETNTPPPHVPRVITPPIPSNATKIGNPTSQCALLGLKLVQLSTLAGRIFFCHSGQISDGVRTELIRSLYAPSLRIYSVYMSRFCLCWRCTRAGTSARPRCRPFSPGVLGASDLILLYYWRGSARRRLRAAVLAPQYSDT